MIEKKCGVGFGIEIDMRAHLGQISLSLSLCLVLWRYFQTMWMERETL